jgi:Anti-sigma-D factor RsdA to sigma factor binding region
MTDADMTLGEPVGFLAVQADDELIDALAAGKPVEPSRVTAILAAWKADVDAYPMPRPLDARRAVAAARLNGRTRDRTGIRLAAGVAVLLAFGAAAVVIGARHACPGEFLWEARQALHRTPVGVSAEECVP